MRTLLVLVVYVDVHDGESHSEKVVEERVKRDSRAKVTLPCDATRRVLSQRVSAAAELSCGLNPKYIVWIRIATYREQLKKCLT